MEPEDLLPGPQEPCIAVFRRHVNPINWINADSLYVKSTSLWVLVIKWFCSRPTHNVGDKTNLKPSNENQVYYGDHIMYLILSLRKATPSNAISFWPWSI
jgi:hypothetical protein